MAKCKITGDECCKCNYIYVECNCELDCLFRED